MKRYLIWASLGALMLWVVSQAFHFYRITFPDRTHAMIEPLKNMQTFCVGRFLIDLPRGTKIAVAMGNAHGARFSAASPVTRNRFGSKVKGRWDEIKEEKTTSYGKPYVKPSERHSPVEDSVLFAFRHNVVHGPNHEGEVGDWPLHRTEAYLWRDDVLYSFTNDALDDRIIDTMRTLQVRPDGEIPAEPGFCGPRSFFPGGYRSESVTIAFDLPTNPKISFRIETTTYPGGSPPPEERPRPVFSLFEDKDYKTLIHRDAKRTVDGRSGVEWSFGQTERVSKNHETDITIRWFAQGAPESSLNPAFTATQEISYETEAPPSPWGDFPTKTSPEMIDKEAFMTYWDTILDTLRPRPGALPAGDK